MTLLRSQAFIDGKWCHGKSTFTVRNPATGETAGTVPNLASSETKQAIDAAARAFEGWKKLTAAQRSNVMRKWFQLIVENVEELGKILTTEQGKPLPEAKGEILYGASFIEWFCEEAKRVYGDVIPSPWKDKRLLVLKEPIGVCAAITPWNFPMAMIARKVAPALAAGCTIVLKPAEQTPLSALALAALAEKAGFPAGVFNVITGDPEPIGKELTENPIVRKLSFTGSTEVGKFLMRECASTVKKISLELGGNAPFIVFDDADLDAAVAGTMGSKFRNSGQTCICANRIFVQKGIYDAYATKLASKVAAIKVGNGFDSGVDQGPLIDKAALEKVTRHVKSAVKGGAKVLAGGNPHSLGGTYYEPTVLTDCDPSMEICKEETFGPIAPLIRFETEKELIEKANATTYGLVAYLYSRDLARVWRVAEALQYGMVGINTGTLSTEVAPFGGMKESGIGREGSKYGIEEYLEIKYVCLGGIS